MKIQIIGTPSLTEYAYRHFRAFGFSPTQAIQQVRAATKNAGAVAAKFDDQRGNLFELSINGICGVVCIPFPFSFFPEGVALA